MSTGCLQGVSGAFLQFMVLTSYFDLLTSQAIDIFFFDLSIGGQETIYLQLGRSRDKKNKNSKDKNIGVKNFKMTSKSETIK